MDSWIASAITGYIGERVIVQNVSLPISSHKITVVLGPSGSGKTSLLRILAGLWDGRVVGVQNNRLLRVGYVAQRDFLFPWMTLERNMTFPAALAQIPRGEVQNSLNELSHLFRIGHLLNRFPYQVSGGELQRALIVRSLVAGAHLLLLDEPMNSLDVASRIALRQSLKSAVALGSVSLVLVTHELPDAISIADYICVCSGPPLQIEKLLTRTVDGKFNCATDSCSAEEVRLLIERDLANFSRD
jgi:ABC-type nitrate/sulfonate/bicarbonate transport system ATPase subunit